MDTAQESMLLTTTQGSYTYSKVCGTMKAIFANTRGVVRSKDTFAAELVEAFSEITKAPSFSDDEESHSQAALEVIVEVVQEQEGYDEEVILETFETYQQLRKKVQETKKTRGFRSSALTASGGSGRNFGALNLRGSIVAKLEQVKARTNR